MTHNSFYYKKIARYLSDCRNILDVGCGDGELAAYLVRGDRKVAGIDVSESCIERAGKAQRNGLCFLCGDFAEIPFPAASFDGIVFCASLHHMDMGSVLEKCRKLLIPGGKIIVVGLASPSSPADHIREAMRVIPAALGTAIRRMNTSEDKGLPVSYDLPTMDKVREVCGDLFPDCRIKYGLYYRYILTAEK